MFRNTKRPVPSPAALRALAQLAYISSGTALGIATLCAEERRRRLQIVQRVADNAKAIRQHPRYVQNAALAVNGVDNADFVGFFGTTRTLDEVPARQIRRRRKGRYVTGEQSADAFTAPELPSVVERGYAETVTARNEEREVRGEKSLLLTDARRRIEHDKSTRDASSSSDHYQPFHISRQPAATVPRQTHSAQHHQRRNLEEKESDIGEDVILRSIRRGYKGWFVADWCGSPKSPNEPVGEVDTQSFRTSRAWRSNNISQHPDQDTVKDQTVKVTAETVTHDIELFFQLNKPDNLPNTASNEWIHVATQLLSLAVKVGSLDDIRSLSLWKLARGQFDGLDSFLVASNCDLLASRIDHEELFDFYASLFSTAQFRRLSPQTRFKHGLIVLSVAGSWERGEEPAKLGRVLFGKTLGSMEERAAIDALQSACEHWLDKNEISLATEVFLKYQKLRSAMIYRISHAELLNLVDMIIDSALKAGQLSLCPELFHWKHRVSSLEAIQWQLAAYIKACGQQRAYSAVAKLLCKRDGLAIPIRRLLKVLDDSCKAILATACSRDAALVKTFNLVYHELPTELRHAVHESSAVAAIKTTWQHTRNLQVIESELPILRNWLLQADDTETLRKFELAVLEIYISANKLDEALSSIARIHHSDKTSSNTMCLAALLFARKGAWDQLARLVRIIEQSKPFSFDADATGLWNKVIRLYSQHHIAADTWDFVSISIEKLGFSPTRATSIIVLRSCVSSDSLDLIPQWLRYLKALGYQFQLDVYAAVDLMTKYWLDTRQNHIVMLWLCHFLVRHVPSFAAENFWDLLKECIGYDMRHTYGQHAVWQQEHAVIRLDRVEDAKGCIPQPGQRHHRTLSFPRNGDVSVESEAHSVLSAQNSTQFERDHITDYRPFSDTEHGRQSEEVQNRVTLGDQSPMSPADLAEHQYHRMFASFNLDNGNSNDSAEAQQKPENLDGDDHEGTDVPMRFEKLRPEYQNEATAEDDLVRMPLNEPGHGNLERQMVLALSLAQFQKVIDLHFQSRDAVGLPASVRSLELAVEASLRLREGDSTEAEKLMSDAREAGMNDSCALGPLILHQMRNLHPKARRDAARLRLAVIDYYRTNDENGWPVDHHVGVHAAQLLIVNGRPEHGINLLTAIFKSEWAVHRSLDVVAMTVYLQGYNRIQSFAGVKWVVRHVLEQNMRINKSFMTELRRSYRRSPSTLKFLHWRKRQPFTRQERLVIHSWADFCYGIRREQMTKDRLLGTRLEWCLKKCAEEQGLTVETADYDFYYAARRGFVPAEPEPQENSSSTPPRDLRKCHIAASSTTRHKGHHSRHPRRLAQRRVRLLRSMRRPTINVDHSRTGQAFQLRRSSGADGKSPMLRREIRKIRARHHASRRNEIEANGSRIASTPYMHFRR